MIRHWTRRRKAEVVRAVAVGDIPFAWACEKHNLSREELQSWIDRLAQGHTLHATRRVKL